MAFVAGAQCGRYRLVDLLGQGGMGQVFRAVDLQLEREVALKLILAADARDPQFLRRFLREGRLAAAVDHPHVVRTLDLGSEGGVPYLALELLSGGSVAERLRASGRLPWREVARLGAEAARGLSAVHAAGLIHRDVKPANLLLAADGRVKVSDFGLVRRASPEERSQGGLTRTGELLGSPHYMAPEQADGSTALDARADLYSLGATLYALLAGHPPFRGSGYTLLRQVLLEPPPPLQDLAPDADPGLVALVGRLLAKAPQERPTSAEEVAMALEALADADVERVGPPARHPARAAWALGLTACALALGGAAAWSRRSAQPTRSPTEPERPRDPTSPAEPLWTPTTELGAVLRSERGALRLRQVLGSPRWKTADWAYALAVAPDGASFLVGGVGSCLLHCDARSGRLLRALPLGRRWVSISAVALSPPGERPLALAVVGPGEVVAFDLRTGTALPAPPAHPGVGGEGLAAAFVPQGGGSPPHGGGWALSAGGRTLRRWRVADPGVTPELVDLGVELKAALAVSPDGRWALLGTVGPRALLWNLSERKLQAELQVEDVAAPADGALQVRAVAFSPRGGWAASGDTRGEVQLWDLTEPAKPRLARRLRHTRPGEHVTSLCFAPDGGSLVSTGTDGTATWWSLEGRERGRLRHRSRVVAAAFLGAAEVMTVGMEEHLLRRWDLARAKATPEAPGHSSTVNALAVAPDGRRLLSVGWDGTLCVWDTAEGALRGVGRAWEPERAPLVVHSGLKSLLLLDQRTALSGGEDGQARRWDLDALSQTQLATSPGPISALDRAQSGAVVLADQRGFLGLLGADLRRSLAPLPVEENEWILGARFVPESASDVVTATASRGLRRWRPNGASWEQVNAWEVGALHSLAVSGQRAFVGRSDGALLRVDLSGGEGRQLLTRHEAAVKALTVSADGRWGASASYGGPDRSLRLWRAKDGEPLDRLDLGPAGDFATSLAFGPRGEWLAVGTARGVVLLLDLRLPR
ncbi:MAG: WD40 repeat domain-containing serine/threonine-protein kinase [Planctomycetota bacterium]